MTRAKTVVKRTDRAKRVRAQWASKEPYRDGLTYREWMSDHAKAQRARELASVNNRDTGGETDAPSAAKAAEQPAPVDPPDRTVTDAPGRGDSEGSGSDAAATTSRPGPSAHEDEGRPKVRRVPSWRRRRA